MHKRFYYLVFLEMNYHEEHCNCNAAITGKFIRQQIENIDFIMVTATVPQNILKQSGTSDLVSLIIPRAWDESHQRGQQK